MMLDTKNYNLQKIPNTESKEHTRCLPTLRGSTGAVPVACDAVSV